LRACLTGGHLAAVPVCCWRLAAADTSPSRSRCGAVVVTANAGFIGGSGIC